MGVDIHMSIISKNGESKFKEIFDGRDYEWFDNISGNYHTEFYQNFPLMNGIPEKVPDNIREDFASEGVFYDFFHVNVGEFLSWFEEARPDIDAGWVSTYDKWLYEKKNIVPELFHWLDEDNNPYDYQFIEIENPWECSKWLYDFIIKHKKEIGPNDFIVYYFDC